MIYTNEQFQKDLGDRNAPHSKTLEGARNFYEELGKMDVQKGQEYIKDRMEFINPQGKLIELGCHNGFNLIHFARLGFSIMGIDISQSLLDYAQIRINKEPKEVQDRIRLKRIAIENFNTPERFETIILTEILEHAIAPLPILEKARYLLKIGGQVYIANPSVLVGNASHLRGINKDEMKELLDKAHLEGNTWEVGQRCFAVAKAKREVYSDRVSIDQLQIEGYIPMSKSFFKDYSGEQIKDLFCVQARPLSKNGLYILDRLVRSGDYIVLDAKKKPQDGDFVYIDGSLRKFVKQDEYYYLKIMSEPKSSPIILSEEDIKQIKGVVIKVFPIPENL